MSGPAKMAIWAGLVVAVLALFVWVAPYWSTSIWWEFRRSLFWLVPLLALAIGALLLFSWGAAADRLAGKTGGVLLGVLGFIAWCWWVGSYHSYLQAHDYAASIHVTRASVPALGQRAPYQVAQAQARPDLGDLPGDATNPTYLPAENKFSTLVTRRGTFTGYQATLEQTIPLEGHGAGRICSFAARADARLGGWFGQNLAREVIKNHRWARFSESDVYGYCDHGSPKVVVPLKRQVGVLVVTERSAGFAVYDGRTGHISYLGNGAKVQGPTYPLSLAKQQRESSRGMGGYSDWWFNRVGWASSSEVNSDNNAEFVLPDRHGNGLYVTPLTARGHATAISAISTIGADTTGRGLETLTVHRLAPSWTSPSAIEQRIKADYQDLPNWQNLKVMELAPLDGRRWVATIGNDQNILYRVQGAGDLTGNQATCLYRSNGSLIRCGTLADVNGNGVGTQYGNGSAPDGGPTDLSKLSNQQLLELQRRVAEEIAKRLGQK